MDPILGGRMPNGAGGSRSEAGPALSGPPSVPKLTHGLSNTAANPITPAYALEMHQLNENVPIFYLEGQYDEDDYYERDGRHETYHDPPPGDEGDPDNEPEITWFPTTRSQVSGCQGIPPSGLIGGLGGL